MQLIKAGMLRHHSQVFTSLVNCVDSPNSRNLSPVAIAACLESKRLWNKVPRLAGQRYKGSSCRNDHLLRSAGRVISQVGGLSRPHPLLFPTLTLKGP